MQAQAIYAFHAHSHMRFFEMMMFLSVVKMFVTLVLAIIWGVPFIAYARTSHNVFNDKIGDA